jgi:hypothetical protein
MPCFYILRNSSNPQVIGVNDGSSQAVINRSGYSNPQNYDELIKYLGSNEYEKLIKDLHQQKFSIEEVILKPNANMTNFLSFDPYLINCPFLISEHVAHILKESNLPEYKIYRANVLAQNQYHPYFLLYMPALDQSAIDFKKSTFCSDLDLDATTYRFQSKNELEMFSKEKLGIRAKEIFLIWHLIQDMDMFELASTGIIISEKLKLKLERESACSGASILPAHGNVLWSKVSV